jgi:hypothetical protein
MAAPVAINDSYTTNEDMGNTLNSASRISKIVCWSEIMEPSNKAVFPLRFPIGHWSLRASRHEKLP